MLATKALAIVLVIVIVISTYHLIREWAETSVIERCILVLLMMWAASVAYRSWGVLA